MIATPLIHQFEKDKKLQNAAIESILLQAKQENINFLDISKNEFSNLDFSTLEPLENIKVLDCSYNQTEIKKITISATVFPNLEHLYLYESKIKEIELIGRFPKLETLHLAKNSLSELEIDFDDFPVLETLYLGGNSLINIPKELFDKERHNSIEDVKTYLRSLEGEIDYLHEAKLILIGNGEVGKTSIRFRLIDKTKPLPKKEERTQGIDIDIETYTIHSLPTSITKQEKEIDFELHIWDFGGQGRYREVQQLFCSRKSLYIYVTSYDDKPIYDDDYVGYQYWLSMANAFSFDEKDQKSSPILCVVNKIDEDNTFFLNGGTMRNEFNNIEDIIRISCEKMIDFDKLEQKIKEVLPVISSDIFENKFSKKWLAVKAALEKEEKYHITHSRYLDICQEHNLTDQSQIDLLLKTLDRMGYVIYFREHPLLKDWIILNPLWVKDAIYKVLDDDYIRNAELYSNDFSRIWKEYEAPKQSFFQRIWEKLVPKKQIYTNEEHVHLINLMLAYEFCYKQTDNRGENVFIIPAKLDAKPTIPPEYGESFDVEIRLNYEPFLPAGTVNKLIVRLHSYIMNNYKWKNGAIFSIPLQNGQALVEEDWREKAVFIRLKGTELANIYQLVIEELRSLNKDLKEAKYLNKLEFETTVLYEKDYHKVPIFLRLQEDEKFLFLNEDEKMNIRPTISQMKKHKLTQQKCNDLVREYNSLVEKVGFMRTESVIAYDASAKFNHKKLIEEIENRISEIKAILDNHEIVEYSTYPTQTTMQDSKDNSKNEGLPQGLTINIDAGIKDSFKDFGKAQQSQNQSQSQQIDFKQFVNTLENLQRNFKNLKRDVEEKLEEDSDNKELQAVKVNLQKTIEAAEVIEIEAKKADEGSEEAKSNIKKDKSDFFYYAAKVATYFPKLAQVFTNPKNWQNAKESLEAAQSMGGQLGL
jgi:GTPase SAR1 family protein